MEIRLLIPTPDRVIVYKSTLRYLTGALVFASRLLRGDVAHAATTNPVPSDPKYVGDFVEYWAATRLLLTGNNPYGPQELFDLQRSVGWNDSIPLLMWNPPWTLSFTLPFGLASFDVAYFMATVEYFIVVFCTKQLWFLYGGLPSAYRRAWLVVLTFGSLKSVNGS